MVMHLVMLWGYNTVASPGQSLTKTINRRSCIGVMQLVKKGVAQFRMRDLQLLEVRFYPPSLQL